MGFKNGKAYYKVAMQKLGTKFKGNTLSNINLLKWFFKNIKYLNTIFFLEFIRLVFVAGKSILIGCYYAKMKHQCTPRGKTAGDPASFLRSRKPYPLFCQQYKSSPLRQYGPFGLASGS